ncbi:uncharacterized protein LOC131844946 [Achroia grisella]|uniref:uncharacterized protein LOC131844946 n=1 Tax=Achroia grisella TaxID=688607 RepID=UPI0027D217B2|nr:uncharacterized protein LOC131844946 [Achroia grisella]
MKCTACNAEFNDGVQCGACRKHYDFSCANITESGYRKLGSDRRAAWKCQFCKSSSPAVQKTSTAEPVTLDSIMKELRIMKTQLASLPTLVEDVKIIKNEITDLRACCEFNSTKLEDLDARLSVAEKTISDLERLQDCNSANLNLINLLKNEMAAKDQWSRLNNVEIKGIPIKTGENLFRIVDLISNKIKYDLPRTQINYISRVPSYNSKDKSIILGFTNRYVKEDFIAAARAIKSISASDLGFTGSPQRVFINDHLTPQSKTLLTKAKSVLKEKGYSYIWVKFCKIHVRQNDTSRIFIVNNENDLNKLT